MVAHRSNPASWVMPRSSVMASYLVRPGALLDVLVALAITDHVGGRSSVLTLPKPATWRPSNFTWKLKFR